MAQLIAVQQVESNRGTVQTVNARELHAFLGNRDNFATWIKDRIHKYGFIEGTDFTASYLESSKKPRGGRPSTEYHLSLDMAKELAMVERNDKGKEARLYFIECERKAKEAQTQPLALNDPASLRAALLGYTEKVLELEATVAEQAPKVEGFERIAGTRGSFGLTEAAKDMDMKHAERPSLLVIYRSAKVMPTMNI